MHWVATREDAQDPEDATAKAYAWNDRKRLVSPRQIRIAYEALRSADWLKVA